MIKTNSIPTSRVRLEILTNPQRLDMRKLWEKYGGKNKILVNGPFFNTSTYKVSVHLKIHGKVIFQPNYSEFGIAWNDGESPVWTRLPNPQYDNYFTNTVCIVDGTKREKLTSHLDADGTKEKPRYTSRPAFGFTESAFEQFMGNGGLSLWGLQTLLYNRKWKYGLVGDGGWSTAYKDSNTEYYTSRKIPYWILITILPVLDNEPKGDKPMIIINAYSEKNDGEKKLSNNFKVREFLCNDGSDVIFIAPKLVETLQKIRDHFNKPVIIDSAYRTPGYNKKVGGADFSQHTYGTAADIHIKGVTVAQINAYAETLMPTAGGIGLYTKQGFVHVDVREVKARWSE